MRNHTDVACDETGAVLTFAYVKRLHDESCKLMEISRRLRLIAEIHKEQAADFKVLSQDLQDTAQQVLSQARKLNPGKLH